MRSYQLIAIAAFTALSLSLSCFASEAADDSMTSFLAANGKSVRVLGMLKYCGASESERAVRQEIAKVAIVGNTKLDGIKIDPRLALQIADIQAVGVAQGLSLAHSVTSGDAKVQVCRVADQLAGEVLKPQSVGP